MIDFVAIGRRYPHARLAGQLASFYRSNQFSTRKVTGDTPLIVSVASYRPRFDRSWIALESIARGTARPKRVTVWLDDELKNLLPASLVRLQRRGAEIYFVKNIGAHKKYHHVMRKDFNDHNLPIATMDDDTIYPKHWLADLYRAYSTRPSVINCFRARRFTFRQSAVAPYMEWSFCKTTKPGVSVFFTGVGGVIHPPHFQRLVNEAGGQFMERCATSEDVWLNSLASSNGIPAAQILPEAQEFATIPGSQKVSLWTFHWEGEKDRLIAKNYDTNTLQRVHADFLRQDT
jgi:hypothetical protein